EGAYDAFVSFDEHGIVTAWNPRAEAVFGWTAREAIGRDIARLVVPRGDRDWYRESLGRFIEGEESDMLNRRVEVTARHRDGREFPAEIAISPIELDGAWRFNAFVHDISERLQLEERSGRLFSISLDFMCTFTPEGHFRQINPAWSRVLGWSEEQLLDSQMIDYVHPDDRESTLAHADTLEQDLDGTLAAAGESLGWEFGAAWLPDEEGRAMRCVSNWDGGGETASELTTRAQVIELGPGEGIVGRAWQTGEPSW